MSSFYGGKQGRTYHIVQRYDSVADMLEAFSQGGAYTEANYGQYVIIDTVLSSGRSNLENGLLYRRGFDYNDRASLYVKPDPKDSKYNQEESWDKEAFQQDWKNWVQHPGCGAIYVGQIVGPQGSTAPVQIETWSDFEQQSSTTQNQIIIDARPGKVDSETFNDVIKAGYVNVIDTNGDISSAKIAFDIPYTVFEAEVVDTNPYSQKAVEEDEVSQNHPFYYKWNFTIPGGKHGQDVKEIKIENGSETQAETDGFGNSIVNGDKYFTYSSINYDAAIPKETDHLGRWPYRVIDNIQAISIDSRNIIPWESGEQAKLGDLYRTDRDVQGLYWVCIKAGTIGSFDSLSQIDGENVKVGDVQRALSDTQWRVINLPETAPAHSLLIDYTAGPNDQFENQLRNIDYLSVDREGNMYVFYSNDIGTPYYLTNVGGIKNGPQGSGDEGVVVTNDSIKFIFYNGTEYTYPLKQISSIDFTNPSTGNQDSTLRIKYKDGTIDAFEVPRIQNINFNNTKLTDDQKFSVTYKGGVTDEVGGPVNTIAYIGRAGDNILFLYSDPAVRASIPEDKRFITPTWEDPTTHEPYENLVWYNFGQLGAQYHTLGMYHYADLKGDSTYSDYDENTYIDLSSGFTGDLEDRMGWLVTVTDNNNDIHIYAYDYNGGTYNIGNSTDPFTSHWYEIMDLQTSSIPPDLFVKLQEN